MVRHYFSCFKGHFSDSVNVISHLMITAETMAFSSFSWLSFKMVRVRSITVSRPISAVIITEVAYIFGQSHFRSPFSRIWNSCKNSSYKNKLKFKDIQRYLMVKHTNGLKILKNWTNGLIEVINWCMNRNFKLNYWIKSNSYCMSR